MIYFTADNHFGHENVIRFCDRPFSSAEEMNAAMISLWNERVHRNDTVYVLGDMFFRCDYAEDILKKLKGKKYLIAGNHDSSWLRKFDASKYFEDITKFLETSAGQHKLVLSHRPLVSWDHERRAYMIHGHIHNDTSADFWPLLCVRERALNAGVDINGFRPVTFEELLANNIAFKKDSMQNLSEGRKLLLDYIGQRQNK